MIHGIAAGRTSACFQQLEVDIQHRVLPFLENPKLDPIIRVPFWHIPLNAILHGVSTTTVESDRPVTILITIDEVAVSWLVACFLLKARSICRDLSHRTISMETGRGNRTCGLITPYRGMTMEAAPGKNPVTHVGKLYNLLAARIAARTVEKIDGVTGAQCLLVSQIGHSIVDPQLADVCVTYNLV